MHDRGEKVTRILLDSATRQMAQTHASCRCPEHLPAGVDDNGRNARDPMIYG